MSYQNQEDVRPLDEGDILQKFGRSYVEYNPSVNVNDSMPSTWNLMYSEGGDPGSEGGAGTGYVFEGIAPVTVVSTPNVSYTRVETGFDIARLSSRT